MKRRNVIILLIGIIFLLFASRCLAVSDLEPSWTRVWGGNRDDRGRDVAVDERGNLYMVGSTESFNTSNVNAFLAKYTLEGEVLWEKTWAGDGSIYIGAEGYGVAVAPDGDVYVAGVAWTKEYWRSDPGQHYEHVLLLKYTSQGKLLWAKTQKNRTIIRHCTVAVDSRGSVYHTGGGYLEKDDGWSTSYSFLMKYTPDGQIIGEKEWRGEYPGFQINSGYDLAVDQMDNLYLVGTGQDRETEETSFAVLQKYARDGELLWARNWGGNNAEGKGVAVDPSGNVYITGDYYSSVLTIKYTSEGEMAWRKLPWRNVIESYGYGIAADGYGNVYVVGTLWGNQEVLADAFVIKYTQQGEPLEVEIWGGDESDKGFGITADPWGSLYITGSTRSFGAGGSGAFLIRIQSAVPSIKNLLSSDVTKEIFTDKDGDNISLFIPTSFAEDKARITEERLFGLGRKTLYHPEVRKEHYKEVVKELITQPLTEDHRSLLRKIAEEEIKRLDLGVDEASTFLDLVDLSVDFSTLGINESFITENIASSRFLKNLQAIVKKGKEAGGNTNFRRACQALEVGLASLRGTLTLIDLAKATLLPSSLLQENAKGRLQDIERSLIESESFLLADPAFIRAVDEIKEEMQALDYGWYTKALVAIEKQNEEILSSSITLAVALAHLPHAWAFTLTWGTIKGIASQEDELYQACIAATVHEALYPSASSTFSLAQLDYYSQLSFYFHMVRVLTQPVAQFRYFFSKTADEWQVYYEEKIDLIRELMNTLEKRESPETPVSQTAEVPSVEPAVVPSGRLVWRYETGSTTVDSPTAADGVIYVGSKDGYIYALDADSGELVWRHETGGTLDTCPIVANGIVYAALYDGYIYALDADSGELVWRYETGSNLVHSPTVADGVVYVGSHDDYIYALGPQSGTLVWRYKTGEFIIVFPIVADGVVYVGSGDSYIYALDVDSGNLMWRYETGGRVPASPCSLWGGLCRIIRRLHLCPER